VMLHWLRHSPRSGEHSKSQVT